MVGLAGNLPNLCNSLGLYPPLPPLPVPPAPQHAPVPQLSLSLSPLG